MLELICYGLTGIAAMAALASGFAYRDEFSLRGKRSINLAGKALGLPSRRSGERSTGAIYSGVPHKSLPGEAFHG
jgi:hypothetical protein